MPPNKAEVQSMVVALFTLIAGIDRATGAQPRARAH